MDNNNQPKGMRAVFGIFMILVYVGVGILFLCNVFDIINYGVSIAIGVLLCLYGIFRGYRLYKGQTY
ncbi:hypothetical protein HDR69_02960 [bacterium]|nr:hypothetical protein [Bacteroides sp.]MBD5339551.1 hypothetical protein [Bacteroides sp.]MBD5385368.1 hypothetical protein [bacterium]MDE6806299.1 hypothetical protein [Muribaculaceae bacterium]MDE7510496.1 hypothetical protein [Muribaculaceae bacterium]